MNALTLIPTPEQQAVIDAQEGTVLVLAAVGSGKTTTLSQRVAAAIARGIEPERVLALTFTNRAADHMRESLARVVGEDLARRVVLSTFHALCNRVLREAAERAGLPPDFRILDEDDGQELLRELGDPDPRGTLYALANDASKVRLGEARLETWFSGHFSDRDFARPYVQALTERGAVDFSGLVLLTRALLLHDEPCRASWRHRFDVVLVDEVQDTHLSEYEVLAALSTGARSLCLVGDLDQTIYGWRGSAPKELLARLDQDFGPVRRLDLTASFRATRRMLALADRVAEGLSDRASQVVPYRSLDEGDAPTLSCHPTVAEEMQAIARRCRERIELGIDARRMAVLVRTNRQIDDLARAFEVEGVPCTTVEQFRFFRRAEVKDALALARLVVDRGDEAAARRVALGLVRGVGPRSVQMILSEGREVGLQLSDLLDSKAVAEGDPLWGLCAPDVVVLDTETTGVDPGRDEIIEIAAQRVRGGRVLPGAVERFQCLVRNTVPLGDSERVHQIPQARIDAEGLPAREALSRLRQFIGSTPVAGHNVRFDVGMLEACGRRVGVELRLDIAWDSLPAARRLVRSDRYTLDHLCQLLKVLQKPTHRAMDDVLATVSLGAKLASRAAEHAMARRALMLKHAPLFFRLRETIDRWAALDLRPPELVARIIDDALRHKYPGEPWRLDNLAELAARLEALDDPRLPPRTALTQVLDRAALVKDVDAIDEAPGVRIITMHQSKGLEFDEVHVPGLTDGGLPSWHTLRDGSRERLDEERRVFYVAITRARRRLYLSWHERDERNRPCERSRFLDGLLDLAALEQ